MKSMQPDGNRKATPGSKRNGFGYPFNYKMVWIEDVNCYSTVCVGLCKPLRSMVAKLVELWLPVNRMIG